MGQEWYYAQGTTQMGPLPIEQLRMMLIDGRLVPSTLVWREGMANWTAAQSVAELAPPAQPAATIPVPQAPASPGPQVQTPAATAVPVQAIPYYSAISQYQYAGFWLRFVAFLLDDLILGVGLTIAAAITGFAIQAGASNDAAGGVLWLIWLVMSWLYFALQESSAMQATIGKRVLGIKVTDLDGRRISFARATGRFFGKIISATIIYIGFIMAGFTERKQALHDMMAECLVVRTVR